MLVKQYNLHRLSILSSPQGTGEAWRIPDKKKEAKEAKEAEMAKVDEEKRIEEQEQIE